LVAVEFSNKYAIFQVEDFQLPTAVAFIKHTRDFSKFFCP